MTVLRAAKQLLAGGDNTLPETAIAEELQHINDRAAAPELIAIVNSAPGQITRSCALLALSDNLRDPKTVSAIGPFLSDPDPHMQFTAMVGLKNITQAEACTLPPDWTETDVKPQIERCRAWWQQSGRFKNWQ